MNTVYWYSHQYQYDSVYYRANLYRKTNQRRHKTSHKYKFGLPLYLCKRKKVIYWSLPMNKTVIDQCKWNKSTIIMGRLKWILIYIEKGYLRCIEHHFAIHILDMSSIHVISRCFWLLLNMIILIASTRVPARVHPAPTAPNRPNELINFWSSNS